jgi:Uma2 family endonuclease
MRGKHRYTSADLNDMSVARGARIELLDGELHIYPPVIDLEHQAAVGTVATALFRWSDDSKIGRSVLAPGVIFGPYDEVAPDTMWISHERFKGALDEDGHLTVAPELMVEVVSPDEADQRRVRELKMRLYAEQGVLEYWIIDWQRRSVEIFQRSGETLMLTMRLGERDPITSQMLPGFTLAVHELWESFWTRARQTRREVLSSE